MKPKFKSPQEALRYHVTGAIERGEGQAIVEIPAPHVVRASHTPGEWKDSGHDGKNCILVESPTGTVCAVWRVNGGECQIADARLIAAAPELLAALESMLHSVDTAEEISIDQAIQARAALAKAQKGQP